MAYFLYLRPANFCRHTKREKTKMDAYFAVKDLNDSIRKLREHMTEVSGNLNIRIRPQYLRNLRALAAHRSDQSQRKIIEKALDDYFQKNKEELDSALAWYEQRR